MGKLRKRTAVWPALPVVGETEAIRFPVACPTNRPGSSKIHRRNRTPPSTSTYLHPRRTLKADSPGARTPVLRDRDGFSRAQCRLQTDPGAFGKAPKDANYKDFLSACLSAKKAQAKGKVSPPPAWEGSPARGLLFCGPGRRGGRGLPTTLVSCRPGLGPNSLGAPTRAWCQRIPVWIRDGCRFPRRPRRE